MPISTKSESVRHRVILLLLLIFAASLSIAGRTYAQAPGKPVLLSPVGAQENIPVNTTFQWRRILGTNVRYSIQVATSSTFGDGSVVFQQNNVLDTTLTLSGTKLAYGRTHYWRVRASTSNGTGEFSDAETFVTVAEQEAPVFLVSPSHQAVKQPVYPTLTWEAMPTAQQYVVAIATNPAFNGASNVTTTATSLIPLNQLNPSTTYYWRVRTVFADQVNGPWSAVRSFTTHGPPTSPVTLGSPSNLSAGNSRFPTLTWNTLPSAEFYQVQVSEANNFDSILFQQIGVEDTSATIEDELKAITQYFWRVRGGNDLGFTDNPDAGYGPWSTVRSFITENVKVRPLFPADSAEAVTQPLDFRWEELEGAESYVFELSSSLQFGPFVERALVDPADGVVEYRLLAILDSNRRYYWRVKANFADGESDFSEVQTFRTMATGNEAPPPIVLSSPANGAVGFSRLGSLSWQSEPLAAGGYRLQIATSSDFSPGSIERNVGTQETQYALTAPLLPGVTHYWRVRGTNVEGDGDWSAVWSFTTEALPVTLVSPPDEAVNMPTRPTFVWRSFTDAGSYRLEVASDPGFEDPDYVMDAVADTSARLGEPFDFEATLYWRVRAATSNGFSAWSETRSFSTIRNVSTPPGIVTLLEPADGAVSVERRPTFTWNLQPETERYTLQVATSESFIGASIVIVESNLLDTAFTAEDELDEGTTFYWRVKGTNTFGDGPWSEIRSFGTRTDQPGLVALKTPASGASGVAASPLFTWEAEPNSASYELQVSTTAAFANVTYAALGLEGVSHAMNVGLNTGTLYFWRMRGVNGFGPGPWSEPFSFTTATLLPAKVALFTPADDSVGTPRRPRFVWQSASDALAYELQISDSDDFTEVLHAYTDITNTILDLPVDLAYSATYHWRVRGLNDTGAGVWSDAWAFTVREVPVSLDEETQAPHEFALHPNYPNPFNPTTTIPFALDEAGAVKLTVYDITGRLVATLVDETKKAGRHSVTFDASGLTSGVYLVRLSLGRRILTSKLTLIK